MPKTGCANKSFKVIWEFFFSLQVFSSMSRCLILCFYGMAVSMSLCLRIYVSCLFFSSSFFSTYFLAYFQLPICFLMKARKKGCEFGWVGRTKRSWERGHYHQNIFSIKIKIIRTKDTTGKTQSQCLSDGSIHFDPVSASCYRV